ncbi:MAG: GNAT family N-acetyltransferase [Halioglobus sp.]|nr:GNAT family N-acetyltransferase [Halioglobus sp.]
MAAQWRTLAFDELGTSLLYAVLQLRQQIFVVEQDCAYLDLDGRDQGAMHMLCTRGEQLLAYQRCLPPGLNYPESSLGRVAVCPRARGQQLGRELVQRGIDHNLGRWPQQDICISAQSHLQVFYGSLGFSGEGDGYLEDNIPHRKMRYRAAG